MISEGMLPAHPMFFSFSFLPTKQTAGVSSRKQSMECGEASEVLSRTRGAECLKEVTDFVGLCEAPSPFTMMELTDSLPYIIYM